MNQLWRFSGATVLLALAVCASANAEQVIKIGHVAPLTGGLAFLGKDNENGARLAVEEINANGLMIRGQMVRLQLDAEDDAADPRIATQVAQKLIDDKIVAVVGDPTSGAAIAASRIYNDGSVVQISPSATNPAYTRQGFRTTYRLVATDAQQGPALAKYAANALKVRSVAILDDSTAYGQGLANEFEATAKSLGLQVLSHDATNDKTVDFRAVLTKIKGEKPEAIMYGGTYVTAGPLAKQAKQLGLRVKLLAGDGVCADTLAQTAGNATDNVFCSEAGMALEKMEGGQSFEIKYEKRFGRPPEIYAPFTYDALYIIVDAMKRANSTDPKDILAAMPSTNYRGVTGEITFDPRGDLRHGAISLFTYRSGHKTLIDVVKM